MDAITKKLGDFKKQILQISEIEAKVLDATNNEKWGASGTVKLEIARATRNYNECKLIMTTIWKRLSDTGKNWRHVYKALQLLEYLITHGDERVSEECRDSVLSLRELTKFQYVDEKSKDHGLSVRELSKKIVALLEQPDLLAEERQKARQSVGKYEGFSSSDAKAMSFSRRNNNNNNNNNGDDHRHSRKSSHKPHTDNPVDDHTDQFDGHEQIDDEPPATTTTTIASTPPSSTATSTPPTATTHTHTHITKPRRPSNVHSRPQPELISTNSESAPPQATSTSSPSASLRSSTSQLPPIQSLTSFFQDTPVTPPPAAVTHAAAPPPLSINTAPQDPFGVAPQMESLDEDWAEFQTSATPTSAQKPFEFDDDDFGKQTDQQQQQEQQLQGQNSSSKWNIPSNLVNLDSLSISKESDEPQRKLTINEKMRQMGISQRPVMTTPMQQGPLNYSQKPSPTHATGMTSPPQTATFAPVSTNYGPVGISQQYMNQPVMRGPAISPPYGTSVASPMTMNVASTGSPYAVNQYAPVARSLQTRSPQQF